MSGSMAEGDPRERGFLWNGKLPIGGMAVVAGAPNMGKSTLGYLIAAECDVPTLFITEEEDGEEEVLPKLLAVGGDPAKAFYHPEVRFSENPGDLDYLADLIKQHGIKLIVVDPIQAHLNASLAHDQAVRRIMAPYMALFRLRKVALVLECHLLTALKSSAHPQLAMPAGLRSRTKSGWILAKDPKDDDFRILANAKWNAASEPPASLKFEFASNTVSVRRFSGRGRRDAEIGYLVNRGTVNVGAMTLLISLTKETSERKGQRAADALIRFLREGKDGRMQPVDAVRKMVSELDPPMSFRTAKRAAVEMDMEIVDDPKNKSKKWWRLPDWIFEVVEELTEPGDEISIEEVERPDDTFPEEWAEGDDGGS